MENCFHHITALLISAVLTTGCHESERMDVIRLDQLSATETDDLTDNNDINYDSTTMTAGINAMISIMAPDYTGNIDRFISDYSGRESTKLFRRDVDARLGSLDAVEKSLGRLRGAMERDMPGVGFPSRIYGIITPYNQSVMTVDSVMLIGLNHYLGSDYEGYAAFGKNQAELKRKARIAVDVAEALIRSKYPMIVTDSTTLLQHLLYDGAVTTTMAIMMPEVSISDILGISDDALRTIKRNERPRWNAIIENGLLFSTDEQMARRLLQPAPNSAVICDWCPGRAARYIAHHMVKSYLKTNGRPDDLSELLDAGFYNSTNALAACRYAP